MEAIVWDDFDRIEMRIGTIVRAEPFPEARNPSIKIWAEFGSYGLLQSSAQITVHYSPDTLLGKQIIGVINFSPKRIAGFESQFLVCGVADEAGGVVLLSPDLPVPNGAKLY